MYGTYLSYALYDFFLKEPGHYTVQELTAKLIPDTPTPRQRRNARKRVRRCLDQLVFEGKLLKQPAHLDNNLFAYTYSSIEL